ncbi:hypothetical protein EYF80_052046 [Liparis tanakae]|uniref:Uncharacterized protein n=1 Tax=Liparis tanakae TaxID=230148 RepID=A0A4Z2F977_9TELE|nr:hypothetical protein EYF80_052046 [Liparis tanakae]
MHKNPDARSVCPTHEAFAQRARRANADAHRANDNAQSCFRALAERWPYVLPVIHETALKEQQPDTWNMTSLLEQQKKRERGDYLQQRAHRDSNRGRYGVITTTDLINLYAVLLSDPNDSDTSRVKANQRPAEETHVTHH